jgi:hypothetical protein
MWERDLGGTQLHAARREQHGGPGMLANEPDKSDERYSAAATDGEDDFSGETFLTKGLLRGLDFPGGRS